MSHSLNRIFKVIWSKVQMAWVAVSEATTAHGKQQSITRITRTFVTVAMLTGGAAIAAPPAPNQLPTGGQVAAGIAAIGTSGNTMTVTQTSDRAAINWNTFDIGSQAKVQFIQPSSSAVALNRVNSPDPSQIYGQLSANGQVYLINAAGVYFAPGAQVNVGGIVATTMQMSDAAFMAGSTTFERNGSTGKVINEGSIQTSLNGYIAMLAPEVRNSGLLLAQSGTVAMAAGESITLNFGPTSKLESITVSAAQLDTLVVNRAAIKAPHGLVILSARAANQLAASVVNSGTIEAKGVAQQGGRILLEGSTVSNTGTLDASSDSAQGGTIEINGKRVALSGSIKVDGATFGGKVKALATEQLTATQATIQANANQQGGGAPIGQGGQIQLAANQLTLNDSTLNADGDTGGTIQLTATIAQPDNPFHDPLNLPTLPATLAATGFTSISSRGRRGQGGNITLTGDDIALDGNTNINVSGATGGGTVLLGGDWQGSNGTYQATTVYMGANTSIDASATDNGNGGKVVLWSDITNAHSITQIDGTIKAMGANGTGGQVETSGHLLGVNGTANVQAGEWLLDPADVTISTGTNANYTDSSGTYTPNTGVNSVTINNTTLATALNSGNVTVTTTSTGTATGNILVSNNINWTGSGSLTLTANGDISLGANIIASHANATITLNVGAGYTLRTAAGTSSILTANGAITINADKYAWAGISDPTLNSTGIITIQPTGQKFLEDFYIQWFTLGSNLGGLNVGKSGNTGNVYLLRNINTTGAINIYGGDISLGANLATSNANATITINVAAGNTLRTYTGSSSTLTANGGITINSDKYAWAGATVPTLNSTGIVTIQSVGTSFVASGGFDIGWFSLGSTLGGFNVGKDSNTVSIIGSININTTGAINIYGGDITLSKNLTTTASNGSILLKAVGNISQAASTSVTTSGANVTYWSNSNGTGGGIQMGLNANISTGGGNITLGGGKTDPLSGYAQGMNAAGYYHGVYLAGGNNLLSGNGNISIRGQNTNTSAADIDMGVFLGNSATVTINSGTGSISIAGLASISVPSSYANAQAVQVYGTITSANTSTDAISIVGNASGVSSLRTALGINIREGSTIQATAPGGGITLNGSAGSGNDYIGGLDLKANSSILAASGPISLISSTSGYSSSNPTNYHDLYFAGNVSIGARLATSVASSSANITLTANAFTAQGTNNITTNGTVTIKPYSGSFSSDLTYPFSNLSLSSAVSGLTIGKLNNTANITIATTANIAGPINLYGGTITLTGGLITTNTTTGDIDLFGNITGAGNINLADGRTLTVNQSGASTYSGCISGASAQLIKAGLGTLTLSGTNTYSGTTNITAGALLVSGNLSTSTSVNISSGAAYELRRTATIGSFSGAGSIYLGGYNLTAFGDNSNATFSGEITGSGNLTKTGTGTLTLSGNNSYLGTTIISGGTLSVSSDNNLGTAPVYETAGKIVLNGGVLQATANLTLNANRGISLGDNNGTFNVDPSITLNFAGVIAGTGNMTKSGNGTLVLGGANTYAGSTTISAGTLIVNGSGSLGSGSYAGTISNSGNLTFDTSTAQLLSGSISGSGKLKQNGSGTLSLSGNSSYTGNTTIANGSLQLNSGGSINNSVGIINNGTLTYNNSLVNTAALVSGTGNISVGTASSTGTTLQLTSTLGVTGALNVYSGNVLDLNGQSSPNAINIVGTGIGSGGALVNSNATTAATQSGTVTLSGGTSLGGSGTLTISGNIAGAYALTKIGTGATTLTGTNTYNGTTTISAGTLQIGNGTANGSIANTSAIVDNGTLTFNRSDAVTLDQVISGTGNLTKAGSGTLTLTGTNTYNGTTTISAGTLQIGNGTANGSIANTSAIVDNGTLLMNRSDAVTLSQVVSGTGNLTQAGSGALTLSGINTYSGSTNVTAGTLVVNGTLSDSTAINVSTGAVYNVSATDTIGSISGGGTVNLASGLILTVGGTTSTTFSGAFAGSGALTKAGSGALTLSGANTYSGATNVTAGTLVVSGTLSDNTAVNVSTGAVYNVSVTDTIGSLTGNGSVNLASGATLTTGDAISRTFSGVIAGSGALTKAGSGTLTLVGANTYTGATTISNGTLQIGNGTANGSMASTSAITNNGTLIYDRSDDLSIANTIAGTGAFVKNGSNTLTLTGLQTYTGSTNVTAGGIIFTNDAAPTTSGFSGNGTVTIQPSGNSFTIALSSNYSFATTLTGLTLGSTTNTANITIGSATSIAGNVALYGGNVTLNNALTTTNSGIIRLQATSGDITQNASGVIITSGLALLGGNATLTQTTNNITKLAAQNVGNLSYVNAGNLIIGTVNPTGVNATGPVNITVQSGNIELTEAITTTSNTSSAIILNAGAGTAVGNVSGGNIFVSGNGSVNVSGTVGRATLFTGSVANSTGLAALAGGDGSGHFRYNSNATTSNYNTTAAALGAGVYAIYREQPTLTVSTANASIVYGNSPNTTINSTAVNGDTLTQIFGTAPTVSVSGNTSTAGFYTAGNHTLSISGASTNILGYATPTVSNGTVEIAKAELTVTGTQVANTTYSNSTVASFSNNGSLVGVLSNASSNVSDVVNLSASGNFSSKNVGTNLTVTIADSISGADAANYNLTQPTGITGNITPKTVTLSASKTYDGTTNLSGAVSIDTGIAGETLTYRGATANSSHVADNGSNYIKAILLGNQSGVNDTSGGLASNYQLPTLNVTNAPVTINAATVTLTATGNISKVYDGTVNATVSSGNYSVSGLLAGDSLTLNNLSTATYNSANVTSANSVSVSNLTLATISGNHNSATSDYALNTSNLTWGTGGQAGTYANITPAALTITANNVSSQYGLGTTLGTTNFTPNGLQNGEMIGNLTLTSTGSAITTNVGSYNITANNASGGNFTASNYNISYVNGTLGVYAANITLTAANLSRTYGANNPTTDTVIVTAGKFYNGDDVDSVAVASAATATTNAGQTANLTPSAANFTSGLASNYNITYANGTLTIDKALLGITFSDTYNGTTNFNNVSSSGYTLTGLQNGETISSANLTIANANVAFSNNYVTDLTVVSGNASMSNYVLNSAYNATLGNTKNTVSLSAAPLTITAQAANMTYSGTGYTGGNVSYNGFVGSDNASSMTGNIAYSGDSQGAKNVGNYTITASGQTNSNYAIVYDDGTLTINPAPLGISANGVYSGSTTVSPSSYTVTGLVNGEKLTHITSLTVNDANVSGNGANYVTAIGASNGTANLANYQLTQAYNATPNATTTNVFTMAQANLTVTADNASSFIGQALPGSYNVSYNGFVGGQNGTTAGITVGNISNTATNVSGAGTYTLTPTGFSADNYSISYVNGTYTIVPAETLMVQLGSRSNNYGVTANLTPTSVQYMTGNTTLVNLSYVSNTGDNYTYKDGYGGNVTFTLSPTNATYSTSNNLNAAAYQIGGSNLTQDGNLNLNGTGVYTGSLTVNTVALTASTTNVSKVYDGTTSMNGLNISLATVMTGDIVTASGAGAFAQTNVGSNISYKVSGLTLGGTDASNYYLTGGTSFTGSNGVITAAPLTITANNGDKQYGLTANLTAVSYSHSNLVNGETLTGVTLASNGSAATANVGNYSIVASNATGSNGFVTGNYNISYVNGTLDVYAANITVTADNLSRTYGAANPTSGNITVSGTLYNSDAIASTANVRSTATSTLAAGQTANLTPSAANFTSGLASNYNISYVNGTLTISKAELTITANSTSTQYGLGTNLSAVGYNISGLQNSETIGSVALNSAGSANTTNVGNYNITAATATGGNFSASNYNINYVNGTLDVFAANITVTADNQSRTYGAANPTSGNVTLTNGALYNGDTLSTAALSSGANATSNVGNYTLAASNQTFSNGTVANYNISYVNGILTVDPAPLGITATGVYNGTTTLKPTSYNVTGLVNEETLTSINAVTVNNANVAASTYIVDLSSGGGTANLSNYQITKAYNATPNTTTTNAFTMGKAALTVTADNAASFIGQSLPGSYNVSYNGFVGGQDASNAGLSTGTVNNSATNVSAAGTYTLTPSGFSSSNYSITYVNGSYTIVPAETLLVQVGNRNTAYAVAANITPTSVQYMSGNTTLVNLTYVSHTGNNYTYHDGYGGNVSFTLSATNATYSSSNNLNAAAYQIDGSNLTQGANLNLNGTGVYTGTLDVAKQALTASTSDVSKVYDGSTAMTGLNIGLSPVVSGDIVTANGVGAFGQSNVGSNISYNVSGLTLGGTDASNYYLTGGTSFSGSNGVITVAPLTVTADNASKTYGDTANLGSTAFTSSGLVAGETIGSVTLTSTGAAATANAANYSIDISTATGGTFNANNYNITYVNGTLTVNPAPLGISAAGLENGSTTITPTSYTLIGLKNGESMNVGTVTVASATPGSNNYIKALNNITGTALLANYRLNPNFDGTLGTDQTNSFSMTAKPKPATDVWVYQQTMVQGGTMVYIPLPKLQVPESKRTHQALAFSGDVVLIADQAPENGTDPGFMAQPDAGFTDRFFDTAPRITLLPEAEGSKVIQQGNHLMIVDTESQREQVSYRQNSNDDKLSLLSK